MTIGAWVLIVFSMVSNGRGDNVPRVAMQQFNSLWACQNARKIFIRESETNFKTFCVPMNGGD